VASQLNKAVSYCFALLLQVSSGQPPFIMTTRRTMMLSVLMWLACVSPAFAIVCHAGPDQQGNVFAADYKEPGTLCLRYQFTCLAGDTVHAACTVAQLGKIKWAYAVATKDQCASLITSSRYKSVTCCNSDRCNAPDLKLDPAVKVVPGLIPVGQSHVG
jgi:hypothetical protein